MMNKMNEISTFFRINYFFNGTHQGRRNFSRAALKSFKRLFFRRKGFHDYINKLFHKLNSIYKKNYSFWP